MKKNSLFLLSLLIITIFNNLIAQVQIPNGDFETWTSNTAATSWNGASLPPYLTGTYAKSTDFHGGSFAMLLETQHITVPISATVPGFASLGTVSVTYVSPYYTVKGGISCTNKPVKLKGYYKQTQISTDTCGVYIYLTHWNGTTADTIAEGEFKTSANVSTYTYFEITLTYNSSTTPDTLNINLVSSPYHTGSKLYIDDLTLDYTPLSVNNDITNNNISIFPNPAHNYLNINLNNNLSSSKINIYNILGKSVYKTQMNAKETFKTIDVSALPDGLYFLEILSNSSKLTKKIIIK